MSHPVRHALLTRAFRRHDIVLEDTSDFNYWTAPDSERTTREARYSDVLARSKFCLCPRGVGTGRIRLFEAMRAGVAPVVIADGWVRPRGIPWDSFCLFVGENELERLEDVVSARESEFAALGRAAATTWSASFSDEHYFDYLVETCVAIRNNQRVPERGYWFCRYFVLSAITLKGVRGRVLRRVASYKG